MEKSFVPLTRDNSIQLNCSYYTSPARSIPRDTLIVYVTGIDSPGAIWYPTVDALLALEGSGNLPPMLNIDVPGRPKRHGRDCLDAAHDIRDLVTQIGQQKLGVGEEAIDGLRIFFVASSIGAAICRLYAGAYPKTVSALIILGSTIANSDTISLFPDPQVPGFDVESLSDGRGNLPSLVPCSNEPKIVGPSSRMPYVTVIEHDRAKFVEDTWRLVKLPKIMSQVYFDPQWHECNKGLARLTKEHLSKGPISKTGTGHLIHKDNPQFIAREIMEVIDKLRQDEASHI
ncbi:hypothetical protein BDZ45DRAFT_708659 [Acephala macrosclerotiorum]|nr:hypothetical protein BDZ45DRAFT_708659 [Acephala macrosclerotiorum]